MRLHNYRFIDLRDIEDFMSKFLISKDELINIQIVDYNYVLIFWAYESEEMNSYMIQYESKYRR